MSKFRKEDKDIHFEFFRFQLIPKTTAQLRLFEQDFSIDQLKQRKNEFFYSELIKLPAFKSSYSDLLIHKLSVNQDNIIAIELGNKKHVVIRDENFEEKHTDDFPSVTIVIDNDPETQIIAISQDTNAFTNTFVVANILEDNLNIVLSQYELQLSINPILDKKDFWELVKKYEKKITQLRFDLIKPNLSNISRTFNQEIREFGDSTNSLVTKVELNAPKNGVLENINPDNSQLQSSADYSIEGGAQEIIMKVKGVRQTIKTKRTIKKITLKDVEIRGNPEAVINVFKKITGG